MKKIFILIYILISITSYCQVLEIVDGDYTYTKVIEVNKPKSEIYSILKKWLNNTTSKSKYILDQDDPTTGIISFNETLPTMEYSSFRTSRISYKINIEIKDNKIRYRANNIVFNNNFEHLSMPDIAGSYNTFLRDVNSETEIYNKNKKLFDTETKPRLKKKYDYDANNARNNLRSLKAIQNALSSAIITNENLIKDKLTVKDDW